MTADVVLNPDQAQAIHDIAKWYREGFTHEFRLGGLAGTGKTTVVARLAEELHLDPFVQGDNQGIAFVAPTGKAAAVLSRKLPQGYGATTIHRLMYRPWEQHCATCLATGDAVRDATETNECHGYGSCGCGLSFRYDPPSPPPRLIVCDEASMVDDRTYRHLMEMRTSVLFVGDYGQLPPVQASTSLMEEDALDYRLNTVTRVAADSPILRLARAVRNGDKLEVGSHGAGVQVVQASKYQVEADENTLMLCYTNDERTKHNKAMRRALGFPVERPVKGDRVICLRNNYERGIANGTMGILTADPMPRHYAWLLSVALQDEDRVYTGVASAQPFGDGAKKGFDRYMDLWTYGYCLTVHKAQGSEADDVIVFREPRLRGMSPYNRKRWLYTAVTRAKSTLTIVNI